MHEAVVHHLATLQWTDDLAEAHASVYAHLGTRAVLDGAFVKGYGLYSQASALAQSHLQRMSLLLDRAEIAEWLGEPVSAEGQLLEATVIAQQFEWASTPHRACWRSVLLALAQLHARRDGALALSFVSFFDEIGGFGALAVPDCTRRKNTISSVQCTLPLGNDRPALRCSSSRTELSCA